MSRAQLINMARHNIAHAKAGTIEQAPDIVKVPVQNYFDPDRWQLEMDRIFQRMPLLLAMTDELRNPGDYKAMEAVGMPVLLSRGEDGEVRAFVNMCRHRGAQVMLPGCGNTHRFTCPYHAWTYNLSGQLTGVFAEKDFGAVDRSCYQLTPMVCLERAGLIWVHLDPEPKLPIEDFLCQYDEALAGFNFENWHYFDSQVVRGPNWKIAYDGYLDIYHLPILHKATFGSDFPHRANYYPWGPHQRVSGPNPGLIDFEHLADDEWPLEAAMGGVWTIFPHISIASFDGGGRGVLLSQLFPGEAVGESITVQHYLLQNKPDAEGEKGAKEQFKFLRYVVEEEDYATGLKQQVALASGAKKVVTFGKNEGGGSRFHAWVDLLLQTPDQELGALFKNPFDPLLSE